MKRSFLILKVIFSFVVITNAQVINVPADKATIQTGIDSASNGDTVLVAEGTYFENINFLGKAITVASQFILDGDTAHISKTIIDGSQSTNPDTASVVTMWSGEDTTSVLMGFTITGGKGTTYLLSDGVRTERGGGGVFIRGSGGMITHNIIEGNHLDTEGVPETLFGGGIFAWLYNHHSVVIRKNIIRDNSVQGERAGGAGMAVFGGGILCENNEVTDNSAISEGWVYGGGMMAIYTNEGGVIREAIVRNNVISGNLASTKNSRAGGGGYYQIGGFGEEHTRIYNNIICKNHANYIAGGVFFWDDAQGKVYNNTIVDNTAGDNGKNVVVITEKKLSFYNNIIWSSGENIIPEFALYSPDNSNFHVFNNILKQPFKPVDGVTAFKNSYKEPVFQQGSYALAENSPGIGWALDSMIIDSVRYDAPAMDIDDNPRPNPIDSFIDLGAFESAFKRTDSSTIADLSDIRLWDREIEPSFHRDTLNYLMSVPDTVIMVPVLDPIPQYLGTSVEMEPASDLRSADPSDRTTTLTATAEDGLIQKVYTVTFYMKATDATLRALSVSQGSLDPEFSPDEYRYSVWLPFGSNKTPEVIYETTFPNVLVDTNPAIDVTSNRKELRTTNLRVTPEDGVKFQRNYYIEFNVDQNKPKITWVSDTIIESAGEIVTAISTQSGHFYLTNIENATLLDSLVIHMMDSTSAVINDTASISTSGLSSGTYWLYAVNRYGSVSEPVAVNIIVRVAIFSNPSVRLYPVPMDDVLYIVSDQPVNSIEVYNSIGVMVIKGDSEEDRITVGHLKQGTYFIRIRTNNGRIFTGKLIKY